MTRPILSVDFDGTIHSYTSGWQGAATINDPPVSGAMRFLYDAAEHFDIAIFSSRSHQEGGVEAMDAWLWKYFYDWAFHQFANDKEILHAHNRLQKVLSFPTHKPAAAISLDDRAWQFTGQWPAIRDLLAFKPWNKREGSSKSIDAAMDRAYTTSLPESLIDDISNEERSVVYKARMFVNGAEVPLKHEEDASDVILKISKKLVDAERHNKMLQKRLAKSANVAMIINDLNWIKARVGQGHQIYHRIEMMLEGLKVHRKHPFIEPEVKTTNLVVAPDQWSGPEGMEAAIQALRASVFEKFPTGGKVRSIEIEIAESTLPADRHNKGWR